MGVRILANGSIILKQSLSSLTWHISITVHVYYLTWKVSLSVWFMLWYAGSCWWHVFTQIARFMGPTWGPPGSCRPQLGPMLTPCMLLSGRLWLHYITFHECHIFHCFSSTACAGSVATSKASTLRIDQIHNSYNAPVTYPTTSHAFLFWMFFFFFKYIYTG